MKDNFATAKLFESSFYVTHETPFCHDLDKVKLDLS